MSIPDSLRKYLVLTAGLLCVGLGVLGAFLPLLPTTPFLLAALFFFAESSSKLHRRLLRWPFLRQFWQNYRSGCGVPVKTKVFSLIFLWGGLAFSATMKHNLYYWGILLLVGIAVSSHLVLLKTYKKKEETSKMFFSRKNVKLPWTPDAENLIKKAPPFIVGFVRKAAEREAAERGLEQVTVKLLQELAKRRSPHKSGKFKLNDYFAKKTENPLYDVFSEDSLTNDHSSKLGTGIPEKSYVKSWETAVKRLDNNSEKALYIHIPFCTTRCKYCGFFVNGSIPGALERYTQYLTRELDMIRNTKGIADKQFDIVYFGGGTPSDLSAESLAKILGTVNKFNLSNECEMTLEGRVSSLSAEKIAVCREYGVNRYSLGVQSFNTALRRAMGRLSSREEIIPVLQRLHKNENDTVVIDQIYGLPGQTMEIWEEDIKTLFTECPVSGADHYPLILMPGTLLADALSSGKISGLPSAAERARMFCRSLEMMDEYRAKRISLKHFALDSRERNRYNRLQAYTGNCIPAGCGGGAFGGYFFYQGGTLENYYEKLDNIEKPLTQVTPITPENALMNQLSGAIQNDFSFSLDEIQQASGWTGFDLTECFLPLLKQYEECGLLSTEANGKIVLTVAGQFWNNAVLQNLRTLFRHVRDEGKVTK